MTITLTPARREVLQAAADGELECQDDTWQIPVKGRPAWQIVNRQVQWLLDRDLVEKVDLSRFSCRATLTDAGREALAAVKEKGADRG